MATSEESISSLMLEIKGLSLEQKDAMLLDLCWKILTRETIYIRSLISRQCLVGESLTIGKLH